MIAFPGPVPEADITESFKVHKVRRVWNDWLNAILRRVTAAVTVLGRVLLVSQGAAVVTTAIPAGSLNTGLYRISWFLRITTPATTSSSVTLTFGWTDAGQALTSAAAAVNGNTATTFQTGTLVVSADALTNLTYAAAYASVGGTSMKFKLSIAVESLQ
jgi:hypothetical protein